MDINAEWAPNQSDPEPTSQDLIQAAMAKGFTKEVWAECTEHTLNLLIRPEACTDGRFRAFCLDECEWLNVNGALFALEDA